MPTPDGDPLAVVLRYHERTKHHPHRYARSLGQMDWATQPDPFRTYAGAPRLPLDHPPRRVEPTYDALFADPGPTPAPLDRAFVSRLFYHSLALSAWKQVSGAGRWSLRVNPSSGNLHPTEGYLIAGPVPGLCDEPAVYHYAPYEHALERRGTLRPDEWQAVAASLRGGVLLALTTVYWREAWKYGERAFRYCQHDVGHAVGAVAFAARVLGWQTRLLTAVGDADLAALLGTDRQTGPEAEHPDCLLALWPGDGDGATDLALPAGLLARLRLGAFAGTPNVLSRGHHDWPVIGEVARSTVYPGATFPAPADDRVVRPPPLPDRPVPAERVIRQRRSAVDMDGVTSLPREAFYRLLARTVPGGRRFPFGVLPWVPCVALALFVHRVEGLDPGLYLLARDRAHRAALASCLDGRFGWSRPPGCPAGLDLYLLHAQDVRDLARTVSCRQDIAADGAFAVAMLAEFLPALERHGPWFYTRLHWEAGLIGQVLYLEAEAAGVRATGIGCFFDDLTHDLLGLHGTSWQTLYHFTVGGAVEDTRLQTLPPYAHLGR